ncbi:hypothetical protein GQ53DRAFT_744771 [Thozetella sp. PMI_491]|nr:hypothetical protein GQ53DRAFT_744771 [Thozetella sp. PMI_491]
MASTTSGNFVLLPTPPLTFSVDPSQCTTVNVTQYFSAPRASSTLVQEFVSYSISLTESAAATATDSYPVFPSSRWCDFTTFAPSSMLSDYSAYASAASSWKSEYTSAIVSAYKECPVKWMGAALRDPNATVAMNLAAIFGECYAEAQSSAGTTTTQATASAGSTATGAGTTSTNPPNAAGRQAGARVWLLITASVLAAVVTNSV